MQGTVADWVQEAKTAPNDATAVTAGRDCHTAAGELAKATSALTAASVLLAAARQQTQAALTAFTKFVVEHSLPHNEAGLLKLRGDLETLDKSVVGVKETSAVAVYAASNDDLHAGVAAEANTVSDTAAVQLDSAGQRHDAAGHALDVAEDACGATETQILDAVKDLQQDVTARKTALRTHRDQARDQARDQVSTVPVARGTLDRTEGDREVAEPRRAAAETRWWSVTNAGQLMATDLDSVGSGSRSLTRALGQARPYRSATKLRDWPETTTVRDQYVAKAQQATTVGELRSLRAVLESSGGRTVDVVDRPDRGTRHGVWIRVDSSGTLLAPARRCGPSRTRSPSSMSPTTPSSTR